MTSSNYNLTGTVINGVSSHNYYLLPVGLVSSVLFLSMYPQKLRKSRSASRCSLFIEFISGHRFYMF